MFLMVPDFNCRLEGHFLIVVSWVWRKSLFSLLHTRNGDRFRIMGMYLSKVEVGVNEKEGKRCFQHVKH